MSKEYTAGGIDVGSAFEKITSELEEHVTNIVTEQIQDKEIELLNKIIEKAIEHGAGRGGEFVDGEELKKLMENYLEYRGLQDKYCVDNPAWNGVKECGVHEKKGK